MSAELSLGALLTDEALRRREFPVCAEKVHLAHAAVGPLPARVVRAVTDYLERAGRGGQFEHLHAEAESGARQLAAGMLGVSPEEIAFVPSTSAGLSLVAAGLPWEAGDNVVIPEGDFPSNVYPWLNLRRLGVRVKSLPAALGGAITVEDVAAVVDERTRLVALSAVHFVTGAVIDLESIGSFLRQRGVLFCVDAIQGLGAVPISGRQVDFLVADAHKWLLGPQGIGVLYVRRGLFPVLRPALLGWKSVVANKDFTKVRLDLPESARRYEPGSLNAMGLVGLHAALALLTAVGGEAIARRLAELRELMVRRLQAQGHEVLGAGGTLDGRGRVASGIVSFHPRKEDAPSLYRRLDASGVVTSLRADPAGRDCVRVAPHFYTSNADIEAFLERL